MAVILQDTKVTGAQEKEYCSWDDIEYFVAKLAKEISGTGKKYDCILGITNGGIIPARLLARNLGITTIQFMPIRDKTIVQSEIPKLSREYKYLIVDDIYDTGETYRKVAEITKDFNCDFAFCMSRYDQKFGISAKTLNHSRWIVFPWESDNDTPKV